MTLKRSNWIERLFKPKEEPISKELSEFVEKMKERFLNPKTDDIRYIKELTWKEAFEMIHQETIAFMSLDSLDDRCEMFVDNLYEFRFDKGKCRRMIFKLDERFHLFENIPGAFVEYNGYYLTPRLADIVSVILDEAKIKKNIGIKTMVVNHEKEEEIIVNQKIQEAMKPENNVIWFKDVQDIRWKFKFPLMMYLINDNSLKIHDIETEIYKNLFIDNMNTVIVPLDTEETKEFVSSWISAMHDPVTGEQMHLYGLASLSMFGDRSVIFQGYLIYEERVLIVKPKSLTCKENDWFFHMEIIKETMIKDGYRRN